MRRPRSRTAVRWLCGLLVVLSTAGCLGASDVSNGDAERRALAAEAEHLTARFENASCVENWGLTSYVGVRKEATVVNRTADGVYVEVAYPYWYSTERVEADVGSDARYLVTADDVRRISGTEVSPC